VDAIPLRAVLPDSVDPALCKLHCAVWNGENHPTDVLARSWDEWTDWNRWRSNRDEFNRPLIFSLARDRTDASLWLFGGIFEVVARRPVPQAHSYDVAFRDDLMAGFIKRLVLRFKRPGRAIRLNMETHVDQFRVHSLLASPYAGEAFPGHDQINHTLAELQVVVSQNRPDWRVALQHMKGVYVLHDRTTGEPYVGAAYGDIGIWDRLCQYSETLHGGNVGLAALVNEKGADYARNNLSFALLEFWSMRTEDKHVLDREAYWKRVLMSREHGLNLN
jgi:hypothetical protein